MLITVTEFIKERCAQGKMPLPKQPDLGLEFKLANIKEDLIKEEQK